MLGVSRDADAAELKRAFFSAAKRCHPDTSDDPAAAQKFLELKNAYEELRARV